MLNLGIDLDDVLADFMSAYAAICYREFGKPKPDILPVDWEWSNFGLTKEQMDRGWEIVAQTRGFWEGLKIEDGVDRDRVHDLSTKHNLFFITARVPSAGRSVKDQSCNWLRHNFGIDNPIVLPSYDKGPLAAALKLDAFIDDRPKNLIEVQKFLPTCSMFLKDSSHNQPFSAPGIARVRDMNEFMDLVDVTTAIAI
jgi:5'(3')-deoxyribonucleotidase